MAEVILNYPDMNQDFGILVNASTIGTAAILPQIKDGRQRVFGFCSKLLRPCEAYTITELEFLTLIHAIRKWRRLLTGWRVHVYSDNQALVYFRNVRYWNNRLYRWNLEIHELEISANYVPGVRNQVADAPSITVR